MIFENIPVHLNLADAFGSPLDVIGFASAERRENGTTKIEIVLDPQASKKLEDLAEVFDLMAIGFAGMKRQRAGGEVPEATQ